MNRYLIQLGPINITWYAFLIVLSMIIAFFIVIKQKTVKENYSMDDIYDYFFYLAIFCIIGARTWYVLFSLNTYVNNPLQVFAIWNGGLAIHGGLIGGLLYTIYYSRKRSKSPFILTDALIAPLLLGQAIGRWGNFINQEAHGPETTKNFLQNTLHLPDFIVNGMNINGLYYQPTFLYESLWNFLGFLIVILILQRFWKYKFGLITSFYLIWYGFIRTIIEQFRTDALMLGNIRIAQLTSFTMFIAGIILMVILIYIYKSKNKL